MRPLLLQMQAFGPYAGTEKIDFTQLGNRNMFVISGKTGAGKTTIFDGISFAIFGKASGDDRTGTDLRSHFASPDLLTEVSLTFQLQDKTFYIWRSPMQEKLKKSGDGVTVINAKAEFYELTSEGKQLLASNVRDVDEKIKQIIGLDANQFKQILMIPQGEFKKLLVSDSKEKEVILQKLFHTQLYKKMEEKLKEKSTVLKKQEEQLHIELQTLIDQIHWFSEEKEPQDPYDPRLLTTLKQLIEQKKEEITKQKKELEVIDHQVNKVQTQLAQGKELLGKFEERDNLREAKKVLDQKQEEHVANKGLLQQSQKAGALEKQEQAYLRIGNRLTETKELIDRNKQELQKVQQLIINCREEYEKEAARTEEREAAASKVLSLQELQNDVKSFASFQQQVLQEEILLKKTEAERISVEEQYILQEKQMEQLNISLQGAQKASVHFTEKAREHEKQEEALQLLKEYEQACKEEKRIQGIFEQQTDAMDQILISYEKEKQILQQLEESMLHFHASLLAADLQEGEACAVCGSTHHPRLASESAHGVSGQELEQQKKKTLQLEQQKTQIQHEHMKVKVQLESLQENLKKQEAVLSDKMNGFRPENLSIVIEDLLSSTKRLAIEVSILLKQKNQISSIEENMKQQKLTMDKNLEIVKELKKQEELRKEAYIQIHTKLDAMKERLPEELRSEQQYELVLKQAIEYRNRLQQFLETKQRDLQLVLQEEAKTVAVIETNENNVLSLQKELDEERQIFKQEMIQQGFESYQVYKEAKKTDAEMQKLQEQIEQFETEYQRVSHLLMNSEFSLKNIEKPNIIMIQEQLNSLLVTAKNQRELVSGLEIKIHQNEKIATKMTTVFELRKEVQEKYETIGHLFEITKGQNPFRITFERFVLAAFLDDILIEANQRLKLMTSGRYELLRKTDPTKRNIQSGLELSVFDQYTGTERHVKTLSGGESFKASLSLALGLAAVVQQNTGGISLETMFIDEGFGTLDPESLDQSIEALLEIQSSGRLVGIISHVPELKERIDARLEVTSTQSGSRTKFILS